jgi:hypothetical protein
MDKERRECGETSQRQQSASYNCGNGTQNGESPPKKERETRQRQKKQSLLARVRTHARQTSRGERQLRSGPRSPHSEDPARDTKSRSSLQTPKTRKAQSKGDEMIAFAAKDSAYTQTHGC